MNPSDLSTVVSAAVTGTLNAITVSGKSGGRQTIEITGPTPLRSALGGTFNANAVYQINGTPATGEDIVNPGDSVFVATAVQAG